MLALRGETSPLLQQARDATIVGVGLPLSRVVFVVLIAASIVARPDHKLAEDCKRSRVSTRSGAGASSRVRRASTNGSQICVQVRLIGHDRPSADALHTFG